MLKNGENNLQPLYSRDVCHFSFTGEFPPEQIKCSLMTAKVFRVITYEALYEIDKWYLDHNVVLK